MPTASVAAAGGAMELQPNEVKVHGLRVRTRKQLLIAGFLTLAALVLLRAAWLLSRGDGPGESVDRSSPELQRWAEGPEFRRRFSQNFPPPPPEMPSGPLPAPPPWEAWNRPLHNFPLKECWRLGPARRGDGEKSMLRAVRATDQDSSPSVIPLPVELTFHTENGPLVANSFALTPDTPLYIVRVGPALRDTFHTYFGCFFDFNLREVQERVPDRVELVESMALPPEGYELQVEGGVAGGTLVLSVAAETPRASLLHALQTLRQLLPAAVAYGDRSPKASLPLRVPNCDVKDWPRYRWRGVMLDVARHFFDVEQVKDLLWLMSMHKLSKLHLHLCDDQGWRVEVESKPELTAVGARRGESLNDPEGDGNGEKIYNGIPYTTPRYFTKDQVRELVAFASALNIELVPEVNVPAHTAALIVAAESVGKGIGYVQLHEGCSKKQGKERLKAAPNCMGGTHGILLPTQETLRYLFSAVEEVADLFPGHFFHIGGDEAGDFRDAAYSTEVAESLKASLGLPTGVWGAPVLQGYMVTQVHHFLRKLGKTAIAWDDTIFGLMGYTPPADLVAMWWRDWAPEAEWHVVGQAPRHVIVSPTSKTYLDLYQMEPHRESQFRAQEGTVTLQAAYSTAQLESTNLAGVHACLWSEHLLSPEVLEYELFPRGAALAEVAWTPRPRAGSLAEFGQRWHAHKLRLDVLGVGYYDGSYTGLEKESDSAREAAWELYSRKGAYEGLKEAEAADAEPEAEAEAREQQGKADWEPGAEPKKAEPRDASAALGKPQGGEPKEVKKP